MEDLLVLGIVPNTNIQIDFEGWLVLVQVILLMFLILRRISRKVVMWYQHHLENRVLRSLIEYHTL